MRLAARTDLLGLLANLALKQKNQYGLSIKAAEVKPPVLLMLHCKGLTKHLKAFSLYRSKEILSNHIFGLSLQLLFSGNQVQN